MLDVVVLGIARPISEVATVVEARGVSECALDRAGMGPWKEAHIETHDSAADRCCIGGLDGAGNVAVVALHRGGFRVRSIGIRSRHRAWRIPQVDELTDEEKAQIRERLHALEIEHHDLDDVILRLSADPRQDQLQLQRLKKRKLLLKDQIQRLRARLIPDIIA